jgi:hypothetical protein
MSSFGTKEAWMEPMNVFLSSHRMEFKKYLDDICSISTTSTPTPPIPPSYSTPIAILHRLPPTFKEGFPSLPYLIDHSRNFAMLVNLWLDNTKKTASEIQASDGDLLRFHNICVSLNDRTKDCLNRAEPAERPSSTLSVKWEELVEQLQGANIETGRGAATRNRSAIREEPEAIPSPKDVVSPSQSPPITMKPPPKSRHQQTSSISASASSLTSNSSATVSNSNPFTSKGWSSRNAPSTLDSPSQSASASASASVSAAEETPPGSSDGLHMAPAPSYPQTLSHPSASHPSASHPSFNYSNPNVHINIANAALRSTNSLSRPPRSAGGLSLEGSETGSIAEEEYTTALPAWSSKDKDKQPPGSSKEKENENEKDRNKDKDRKDRGLRGVLPFPRKRHTKDKDKDREKEEKKKDKRDKSAERNGRSGSGLGDYGGSFRGKSGREKDRDRDRERDEEF